MHIQLDKTEGLNATLTINISRDDYEKKYHSSLEDYRRNAQFKGFRKGKTPLGYIRKIYGKGALAEVVNKLLQKSVMDHLIEEKIRFLGQPMPAEDQGPIDFDIRDLRDYEFKFDLGLSPDFKLMGMDQSIERFDVSIPDESVEEEWTKYRKRLGSLQEVEDIEPDDIIYVRSMELGEDGLKEDGWEASFAIKVDDFADEELKAKVLTLGKGGSFDFDIHNFEKDKDADYVRKYHLGLEDAPDQEISDHFHAEIERVQRMQLAEVNEELFEKMFRDGDVQSEDQALEKVREGMMRHYDRQADAMMHKEMQKLLMSAHDIDLPEEFLQRWLESRRTDDDPEVTEQDQKDFLLDLKWHLIKENIEKEYNLEVTTQDIQDGAFEMVYSYLGPYAEQDRVKQLAQTVLESEEQVERISRDVMAEKVIGVLKETFNIAQKSISVEGFDEEAARVLQTKGVND